MSSEVIMVLCTCPDPETAETLSQGLLEARIAACVNQIPGVRSSYIWEGAIEHNSEVLLLIKTRTDLLSEVDSVICALHPYELPEILGVPATKGSTAYLDWIKGTTR
ncbi:MAG: divalent-cation tolerance protein CutA [Gammaproteobacteria bacterium]